jgi:hypothetical protein
MRRPRKDDYSEILLLCLACKPHRSNGAFQIRMELWRRAAINLENARYAATFLRMFSLDSHVFAA